MTLAQLVAFLILTFITVVLACCFALGRMHRWLKDKGEGFGNGATKPGAEMHRKGPWG